jgi:hypothetical protein
MNAMRRGTPAAAATFSGDDQFRYRQGRSWLQFLNTYSTMCIAPRPVFRRVLEEIRELQLAA